MRGVRISSFTSAIAFQQSSVDRSLSVDGSEREYGDNRHQTTWAKFELAHILYFGGEPEKAKSLATETLAELQQLNAEKRYIARETLDTFCQWQLRVIAEGESGARVVLGEAVDVNTSEFEEWATRWASLALGMAHEELGNHHDAIDAYETAVRLKYKFPSYPQFHFDDRLLELLARTNQLDRGERIFQDALETRREDLPDRHPLVGLTRLRLADVLIRDGEDSERAIELLGQARETMQLHKTTPQHVFDRIDLLTEQARSL